MNGIIGPLVYQPKFGPTYKVSDTRQRSSLTSRRERTDIVALAFYGVGSRLAIPGDAARRNTALTDSDLFLQVSFSASIGLVSTAVIFICITWWIVAKRDQAEKDRGGDADAASEIEESRNVKP